MLRLTKCTLIVLLVVVALVFSFNSAFVGAKEQAKYLSRGEVARMVLDAADYYNPGFTLNDIIYGYGDGSRHEQEPATRVEALVMVSRAFADLPAPRGDDLRRGVFDQALDNVPLWAAAEVDKLKKAGILYSPAEGKLAANEHLTEAELNNIIKRIWALQGSNFEG